MEYYSAFCCVFSWPTFYMWNFTCIIFGTYLYPWIKKGTVRVNCLANKAVWKGPVLRIMHFSISAHGFSSKMNLTWYFHFYLIRFSGISCSFFSFLYILFVCWLFLNFNLLIDLLVSLCRIIGFIFNPVDIQIHLNQTGVFTKESLPGFLSILLH